MKYVRCDGCFEIIRLIVPKYRREGEWVSCSCGTTCGRMVDAMHAEYFGGTPIIISEKSYTDAKRQCNEKPRGAVFYTIIPSNTDEFFHEIGDPDDERA